MKNITKYLTVLIIFIVTSCSNEENESVITENQSIMFRIENVTANYDLSFIAYAINDDYENPIPACNSVRVRPDDRIVILGINNISPDTRIKAVFTTDVEPIREIVLHRTNNTYNEGVSYESCYTPNGTTALLNPSYWADDSGSEVIVVE